MPRATTDMEIKQALHYLRTLWQTHSGFSPFLAFTETNQAFRDGGLKFEYSLTTYSM